RSVVHLRPLGSAGHICDETASFSHTNASSRCWNGNTSHMYHTTSSPTSRGKYRWIILTSPLTLYPLWYRVTNTTTVIGMVWSGLV
ncbi:Telomere-associated helicase, partial [Pyrenophora tritici-repentis]